MKNNLPEFKLSYKKKGSFTEMYPVRCSEDAAEMCRSCFNPDTIDWREEAIVIALNRNNLVLGYYPMSNGGVSGTVVDQKVVFQVALTSNACRLILAHNHPSGNLRPSQGDRDITDTLVKGAKLLDITIVDHIIITSEGYTSFVDEGWL
jgi:DNA repair protein RadC